MHFGLHNHHSFLFFTPQKSSWCSDCKFLWNGITAWLSMELRAVSQRELNHGKALFPVVFTQGQWLLQLEVTECRLRVSLGSDMEAQGMPCASMRCWPGQGCASLRAAHTHIQCCSKHFYLIFYWLIYLFYILTIAPLPTTTVPPLFSLRKGEASVGIS